LKKRNKFDLKIWQFDNLKMGMRSFHYLKSSNLQIDFIIFKLPHLQIFKLMHHFQIFKSTHFQINNIKFLLTGNILQKQSLLLIVNLPP